MRRDATLRAMFRLDAPVDVLGAAKVLLLELVLHRVLHAERRSYSCVGCQSRIQYSADFHLRCGGGSAAREGVRRKGVGQAEREKTGRAPDGEGVCLGDDLAGGGAVSRKQ